MDRDALWEATKAARRLIAQSKNPRIPMGRHSPTGVAAHVAHEVIRVYLEELEKRRVHGPPLDRCDPSTGHHSIPHRGCILR